MKHTHENIYHILCTHIIKHGQANEEKCVCARKAEECNETVYM